MAARAAPSAPARPAIRPEAARPLLTLCLATYKRARYLDRYLTHHLTAFETAGLDYELIVSDDCSPDETPDILARYAARHPRMRVIRQPQNVGSFANMLITQRAARGEVVVSVADDDLMVPHQLLAYVRRMDEQRELVMVQAPWFLMDENQDNAIIGKFYDIEAERVIAEGDYAGCLGFVLKHHIFPECWLIRRSAIPSVIGPAPRYAYHFFNVLTRALGLGPVLFSPDPHIMATAMTKGATHQEGNAEVMEGWDRYRGGIEYLASHARQFQPGALADPAVLAQATQEFTLQRMVVAARFNAFARKWGDAYHLQRRLHAYGVLAPLPVAGQDLARLAALEAAFAECVHLGARRIIVPEPVSPELIARLEPPAGVTIVQGGGPADDGITAWCHLGGAAPAGLGPRDFAFDLMPGVHRFQPVG
jgi:hypothetical protein